MRFFFWKELLFLTFICLQFLPVSSCSDSTDEHREPIKPPPDVPRINDTAVVPLIKELASNCALYYYGTGNDHLVDIITEICSKISCDNLITSLAESHSVNMLLGWTDFNFHRRFFSFTSVNHTRRHPIPPHELQFQTTAFSINPFPFFTIFTNRHHPVCLVLLRTTPAGMSHRDLKPFLEMADNGRVLPNFIFLFTNEPSICRFNLNTSSCFVGRGLVFLENLSPSPLILVEPTTSSNASTGLSLHIGYRNFVKISEQNASLELIQKMWHLYKKEIPFQIVNRHEVPDTLCEVQQANRTKGDLRYPDWDNLHTDVCNGLHNLQCTMVDIGRKPDEQRVWDPQEQCVYETLISKLKSGKQTKPVRWPFSLEYNSVTGSDAGTRGKFYIPVSGRYHGFTYSIYIDRKSVKTELDMMALLRPFHLWVWNSLLVHIALVAIFMKLWSKFPQGLWLFAVLLEQGILPKNLKFSFHLCLLSLTWLLSTIPLRLFYTGKMFSAITAAPIPPIPENLTGIFNEIEKRKAFHLFSSNQEILHFVQGSLRHISLKKDIVSGENILEFVKRMDEEILMNLIYSDKPGKSRDSFFSKGSPRLSDYPRIGLVSYTHPQKLQRRYPQGGHDGFRGHHLKWSPPFPLDTMLLTFGRRILIPNSNPPIQQSLWIYQGKRNVLMDAAAKDLGALVESGIYKRWETITCKIVETVYLKRENEKMKVKHSGNLYSAACRDSTELREQVVFRPVTNGSIKVVWVLFLICIAICCLGYFREIVRFDIPGMPCPCRCSQRGKYKEE